MSVALSSGALSFSTERQVVPDGKVRLSVMSVSSVAFTPPLSGTDGMGQAGPESAQGAPGVTRAPGDSALPGYFRVGNTFVQHVHRSVPESLAGVPPASPDAGLSRDGGDWTRAGWS